MHSQRLARLLCPAAAPGGSFSPRWWLAAPILAAAGSFACRARQRRAWLFRGPCWGRWNLSEVSAGVHAKVCAGFDAPVPRSVLGSMQGSMPGSMVQCRGLCHVHTEVCREVCARVDATVQRSVMRSMPKSMSDETVLRSVPGTIQSSVRRSVPGLMQPCRGL